MFRFLFFVFSFISVVGFAQTQRTLYYDHINKAEAAILNLSREEALAEYRLAFDLHAPFTEDLMNAYHCAMQLGRFDLTKTYLYGLLQRGIKEQHVTVVFGRDMPPHINDSIRIWISQFVRADDSNAHLRAAMITLNRTAQDINSELESDVYVRDSFGQIYSHIKVNSDRLFELFKKYGVPNEIAVGQLSGDPSLPVLYNNALKQYFRYIDRKEDRNGIDSMLYKAVLAGNYSPEEFVTLLGDSYYARNRVNFKLGKVNLLPVLTIKTIYAMNQGRHYPEYLCNEETVNVQRKTLGLDDLAVFRQKIAFCDEQIRLRTPYAIYLLHDRSDYALSRQSVFVKQVANREDADEEIKQMEKCK
jgi:hypothetical protein